MVSMKDIAQSLNLSRCTVSNILNDNLEGKSYRKETIEMVQKRAKEMGYVSNVMARALKTGQRRTIAIVVPDIANAFYIKIIKEVERQANKKGYCLVICMAEEMLTKEKAALTMLQSQCVDGVLISPVSYTESLKNEYPYKIVCFDRAVEGNNYTNVLVDNYTAAKKLTEKLINDGARNPLFLTGSKKDYSVVHRFKGFVDAMQKHDIQYNEENIIYDIYNNKTAVRAINSFIKSGKTFDSIFLTTNYFIFGVLQAIRENGIDIVSIGGFEKFDGMHFVEKDIALHVVEQPEKEMGNVALDILLNQINGKETESVVLSTKIK